MPRKQRASIGPGEISQDALVGMRIPTPGRDGFGCRLPTILSPTREETPIISIIIMVTMLTGDPYLSKAHTVARELCLPSMI